MSKLLNKVLDIPQESVGNKISIEQAQSLILSNNKLSYSEFTTSNSKLSMLFFSSKLVS